MRILRLVMPVMVASAVLASVASAATQQAAKDRFAQDAQGARIVPPRRPPLHRPSRAP